MIHFDTSFLVDVLRERRRRALGPANELLESLADDEEGCLSIHALCELLVGVELAADPSRERERVQRLVEALSVALPDEETFPDTYARLLAQVQRRGTPVATMDLLIGTAAVQASAALVTRNPRHFRPIPGLDVRTY